MLQSKRSRAELVVEKGTLHTQQSNALAMKQVEFDHTLASVQAVAEQMNVIQESYLVLDGELQAPRTDLLQTGGLLSSQNRNVCECPREHLTSFADAILVGQPTVHV